MSTSNIFGSDVYALHDVYEREILIDFRQSGIKLFDVIDTYSFFFCSEYVDCNTLKWWLPYKQGRLSVVGMPNSQCI